MVGATGLIIWLLGMLVLATAWLVWLLAQLRRLKALLVSTGDAMEAADRALGFYQAILRDVATGQTTLEVNSNGHIIATRRFTGKASVH